MKTHPTIDSFREVYTRDWQAYARSDLQPSEAVLLEAYREHWAEARMLDLGVGAGRTTWIFAPLVADYVGIDVVPRMVEWCRSRFTETSQRRFLLGDASDLAPFSDHAFDVVLFSFNGIDHMELPGRLRALAEIRRVLRPGGYFLFSSHALTLYPYWPTEPRKWGKNPMRWARRWRLERTDARNYSEANALALSPEVRERGWAILPDEAHDWGMRCFYISPAAQVAQLGPVGFSVERVLTEEGRSVIDLENPGSGWWFSYLCR